MRNYNRYTKMFKLPPQRCMDWAEKDCVEKAPVWCSVDLRDGHQALIERKQICRIYLRVHDYALTRVPH